MRRKFLLRHKIEQETSRLNSTEIFSKIFISWAPFCILLLGDFWSGRPSEKYILILCFNNFLNLSQIHLVQFLLGGFSLSNDETSEGFDWGRLGELKIVSNPTIDWNRCLQSENDIRELVFWMSYSYRFNNLRVIEERADNSVRHFVVVLESAEFSSKIFGNGTEMFAQPWGNDSCFTCLFFSWNFKFYLVFFLKK